MFIKKKYQLYLCGLTIFMVWNSLKITQFQLNFKIERKIVIKYLLQKSIKW